MEYGSIEKSVYIDAEPAVVYEVVSSPEHVGVWFTDHAEYEVAAGSSGYLAFGAPDRIEVPMTVVEAVPGRRFSFRWIAPPVADLLPVGAKLTPQNSVLVTFTLEAQGTGTRLTVIESGMREQGWEAALLEHYCNEHDGGWRTLLDRIAAHVDTVSPRSR